MGRLAGQSTPSLQEHCLEFQGNLTSAEDGYLTQTMPTPLDIPPGLIGHLRQHVDRLAGLIGPRHLGIPGNLDATATLIEREFASSGYEVSRQTYSVDGHDVSNIVATLQGTSKADELVIVGAHYDSERETPGADDNASAVAVLLETGRLLRSIRPKRTVRFIAFACEEAPHFQTGEMGSQVYARQCRARGEQIIGMLCLEMLGYYSSSPKSQQVPTTIPGCLRWIFPKQADFLAAVGNLRSWSLLRKFRRGFKKASNFPLFSICLPELIHEIRLSDNSSFWDQGYPALMVTDTSFLRNPHYHQPTDTPDTLDYDRMAQVTMGIMGGILRVAEGAIG